MSKGGTKAHIKLVEFETLLFFHSQCNFEYFICNNIHFVKKMELADFSFSI